MPFVALRDDEQAGRVYIGDYDDPRQALAGATLICPDCRMPMIVKQGAVVCHHFAHKAGDKKPCYWREHSESPEHLLAKRAIIEYLNNEPKPFGDCVIEVEYPVVTPGGKKRYIDVYVETEDGEMCIRDSHSAMPDERGVELAESWSPGKRGEIAAKFRSFDESGSDGITVGTLFHLSLIHI